MIIVSYVHKIVPSRILRARDKNANKIDLTVQPIKLPGKQVKILPDQFPFWICSDIRHWGRVTWPDESSEVKVTRSVASKHEGRSESEHVVEAS